MPDWKSITTRPAGALPANLTTKAAVILLGILIVALVLSTLLTSDDPEDAAPDPETDPTKQPIIGAGVTRRLQTEIEQQQRLDAAQRRAGDREEARQRIRDAIRGPLDDPDAPPPDPVMDPDTGEELSPAEAELRQNLRLEEVETPAPFASGATGGAHLPRQPASWPRAAASAEHARALPGGRPEPPGSVPSPARIQRRTVGGSAP